MSGQSSQITLAMQRRLVSPSHNY